MLIRFFNPNDLIGCGGDINQSDSFRYAEGVHGGDMQRAMWRGCTEGVHVGGMWRGYAEGVHGRGMWKGYAEWVCGGGYVEGVHSYHWLPLALI